VTPPDLSAMTADQLDALGHSALQLAHSRRAPLDRPTVEAAIVTGLTDERNEISPVADVLRIRGAARSLILAGWPKERIAAGLLGWAQTECTAQMTFVPRAIEEGFLDAEGRDDDD